jgi:hypothetical protein
MEQRMKLSDYFRRSDDKKIARAMAEKIILQYPPKVESKLKHQGGRKRLSSILELILAEITLYQTEQKMGWFRKAKFSNEFRWKLAEAGYTAEFVEALTEGVVTHLSTCLREQPSKSTK